MEFKIKKKYKKEKKKQRKTKLENPEIRKLGNQELGNCGESVIKETWKQENLKSGNQA